MRHHFCHSLSVESVIKADPGSRVGGNRQGSGKSSVTGNTLWPFLKNTICHNLIIGFRQVRKSKAPEGGD